MRLSVICPLLASLSELVESHFAEGKTADDDGMDDAFELLNGAQERVGSGPWMMR